MKKILLTLTFSILVSLAFSQTSFTVDGICFTTTGTNTVQVSPGGTYNNGSITIPSSVSYSGQTYNVTSIGDWAFYGCTGLTSITIPLSVTSIGSYAFSGCTGLTSIAIPSSVTSIGSSAFYGCTGLTSFTIPSSVTSIGSSAFYGCTGLTSITIPYSVTSIGSSAFRNCTGLTSITIPSSVTSIGYFAFSGCTAFINVESNNNYYSSKDGVLYNKYYTTLISCPASLKQVHTIPSSVTSIGIGAFSGCTGLTSVIIPPSVTSIGGSAFQNCTGLTIINIPSSVTSIKVLAFEGCTAFINVESNNNYYSSKDGVLYNKDYTTLISCPASLKQVQTIPSSVTSIGESAFSGCTSLTTVTLPSSVTSIGSYAFSGCTGLTTITISFSVTSIGESTFSGCTSLTTVTIPSSVTSIGTLAFYGCTGLTTITIPFSVTSIGESAFFGCTVLKTINSYISNPTDLNDFQFDGVNTTNCKLYIPIGTSSLYKAATGWKDFQNIIEAFVPTGTSFNVDGLIYMINDMNSVGITGKTTYSGLVIPSIVNYLGIDYIITSLGNGSLEYYSNFTDITVPEKVTSIGNYTFNSCTKLSKIQLPSGLQSIGDYAFYNCTALIEIRVNAVAPPTVGSNTFYLVDKSKCTLYVPTGSLSTYKSANQWKDFLNIVEFDATGVENPGSKLFKIYPNPTSRFIHIDLVDNIDSHILKIYNASGQKFYEMRESDNHIQIDVSRYPSGLYFIQTTDQNNRVTNIGRFIRE